MNAVLSTVMKSEPTIWRQSYQSSHTLKSDQYDSGYLAEVAASGYALMSNHRAVNCKAADAAWPRDMLLNMFMKVFSSSVRSTTAYDQYTLYLNISRSVVALNSEAALKEQHQLRAFFHGGHTQLTLEVPVEDALPDYSYAFNRLNTFVNEQKGWDGYGGLPASEKAAHQVETFLKLMQCRGLRVPGLAMGGDGSVAVVWNTDTRYVSADFDGGPEYSFFITEGEEYITGGASPSDKLDSELSQYLIKYFTDDSYSHL
ncbi:hypothetical protein LG197_22370 [Pseudomonas asiatica]|uniref:Uncharacterized protein n=1 Tax=Pseudomonas monteilii TaxID=76759 RepID=A0A2N1IN14_9PSED|nr:MULTISPECIES: hypothetical protein [Pseudomonas]PKI19650.1 hypothetical protein CXB65_21590 [Pseudomonas monteilii]RPD93836.1 hypothetical protein EGN69_13255 [Pseudomonas monteilii]WDM87341.1 hypothetical protein LG197_22370 [Pseudomonas asiatica]